MKANGIARFGLGCALALSLKTVCAATLDELSVGEVIPDSAALGDAAGVYFDRNSWDDTQFYPKETTSGHDGGNLHRIETDLLNLPEEYLKLAGPIAPRFAQDLDNSDMTLGRSGDGILLRDTLGDTLLLDYDGSFGAPGRMSELLVLPMSIPSSIRKLVSAIWGVSA